MAIRCVHGKALFDVPAARCVACEIVWEQDRLNTGLKMIDRAKRRLATLVVEMEQETAHADP